MSIGMFPLKAAAMTPAAMPMLMDMMRDMPRKKKLRYGCGYDGYTACYPVAHERKGGGGEHVNAQYNDDWTCQRSGEQAVDQMSWQQPDELPRNHVYHTDNERTEAHIAQGYVVGDASGQGSLPYENQSCQYGEGGAEIEWQFAECEIVEQQCGHTGEEHGSVYGQSEDYRHKQRAQEDGHEMLEGQSVSHGRRHMLSVVYHEVWSDCE